MNDKVTTDDSSIDSAASALSAGLGAWLPIETAPKDGTPVLVAWEGLSFHPVVAHSEGNQWGTLSAGFGFEPLCAPTHWQYLPLPPPPEVK